MTLFSGKPILDLFKEMVPETTGVPDELLETFITIATARNSPGVFGPLYRVAVIWFAAHLLLVSQTRGGMAGPLSGRRAGEVSENFGSVQNHIPFNDTSYGRLYKDLLDSRAASKPTSTSIVAPPRGDGSFVRR